MRLILLSCALFATCTAVRDVLLETNRIPDEAVARFQDTCGECKTVVHQFVEAIDDPQKLAELKLLLSALCHETSYETECKLIVSRLDLFIKKLEPYLRDSEAVCKKMHLCHNEKLTKFHKVGLLYAKHALGKINGESNDFVCDECQLAAIEFKKVVDDENQRREIKQFLSEKVCKHIPHYSGACDLLLEDFLPEIWQELDALLANPKAACQEVGFCSGKPAQKSKVSPKTTLATFWKKAGQIDTRHGQVLFTCFECKGAITGALAALESTAETQNIGYGLRDFICPILPENLLAGCDDFLTMYAPTVVYMTLKQIDPNNFCGRFKMCDKSSLAALAQMPKEEVASLSCEACKSFEAFMKYEIAQPDFKSDATAGFEEVVCSRAKGLKDLCNNFAQSYVPLAVNRVLGLLKSDKLCTEWTKSC